MLLHKLLAPRGREKKKDSDACKINEQMHEKDIDKLSLPKRLKHNWVYTNQTIGQTINIKLVCFVFANVYWH